MIRINNHKKQAKKLRKHLTLIFAIITSNTLASSQSLAESISIPLNTIKKPASDLIYNNAIQDPGNLTALAASGIDLSDLDPEDNKLWQNKIYSAQDFNESTFPNGEDGVKYLAEEGSLPFTYLSLVAPISAPSANSIATGASATSGVNAPDSNSTNTLSLNDNSKAPDISNSIRYRFTLSRNTHSMLMRTALLRKLGFFTPTPKFYKNLRVFFSSEDEKKEFIKNAELSVIADFDDGRWITENNTQNHSLVFSDAVLEPIIDTTVDYFGITWGFAPSPKNPGLIPFIQRLSKSRAYRTLIFPFALTDIPESINRYHPKFGTILSGHVIIHHPSAESFSACTYEDARWILKRLSSLQPAEIYEIVKAGEFPEDLNDLIYAKLLYKINSAYELFNLPPIPTSLLPNLNINSKNGYVQKGKVIVEHIPEYPQRYSHGDRETPFEDSDIWRFLDIETRTSILGALTSTLNEKLQFLTVGDLFEKRQEEIKNRVLEHIRTNPREPLYQPVEAWGGPIGGFNINATRHISTGTYFESTAPIQLVDNFSVQGSLGYFMTLDGIQDYFPTFTANVSFVRDFTHVRPIYSIKEGKKIDWTTLNIPHFMSKLADILDKTSAVDLFMRELREGEVFNITDSFVLNGNAQVTSLWSILVGSSPLDFLNTISGSAGAARIIGHQTSIIRTKDGIQILIRRQGANTYDLAFDVNYFINLLNLKTSTTHEKTKTDAFVIEYDPEISSQIDEKDNENPFVKKHLKTREQLEVVLRSLFKANNTDLLYAKFKYNQFKLKHDIVNKEIKNKILNYRFSNFNEDHLLKIQYPAHPDYPDLKPEDEQITLFSNKFGELKGYDIFGFIKDTINSWIQNKHPTSKFLLNFSTSPNPANMPYGKAYWKMITSEGDLTTTTDKQYPNVSIVQNVWGGWHLSGSKFKKLIDEISKKYKSSDFNYRILPPEQLYNTTAIDFYRITANLSVLPGGLDRIREFVLQQNHSSKSAKARWLARVFQVLSERLGSKRNNSDITLYNELLKIKDFSHDCDNVYGDADKPTGGWYNGNYFKCMPKWVYELMKLSRSYPESKMDQVKWNTKILSLFEEQIGIPQMMKVFGKENFIFVIRINGFRKGDEDGDLEFFSNSFGDPKDNAPYANGLFNMFAGKTRIVPIELDRSLGSFK